MLSTRKEVKEVDQHILKEVKTNRGEDKEFIEYWCTEMNLEFSQQKLLFKSIQKSITLD